MSRLSIRTSRNTLFAGVVALAILPSQARAATCYSYYRGYYECGNGLANGARIGIGIGVAVLVAAIFMLLSLRVRKRRMRQFREQAQALPTTNTQTYPSNYQQPQNNSYYTAQFQPPPGAPPVSKPPQTYQPSAAGQYGGVGGVQEHDYEYRQAEENRRLEEEEARRLGTEPPPPTYDAVTGRMNSNTYQPPVGPPPGQQGVNVPAGGAVV